MRRAKKTSFNRKQPPAAWEKAFADLAGGDKDTSRNDHESRARPQPESSPGGGFSAAAATEDTPAGKAKGGDRQAGGGFPWNQDWPEDWNQEHVRKTAADASARSSAEQSFAAFGSIAGDAEDDEDDAADPPERQTLHAGEPSRPRDFPRRGAGRRLDAWLLPRSFRPLPVAARPLLAAALIVGAAGTAATYLAGRPGTQPAQVPAVAAPPADGRVGEPVESAPATAPPGPRDIARATRPGADAAGEPPGSSIPPGSDRPGADPSLAGLERETVAAAAPPVEAVPVPRQPEAVRSPAPDAAVAAQRPHPTEVTAVADAAGQHAVASEPDAGGAALRPLPARSADPVTAETVEPARVPTQPAVPPPEPDPLVEQVQRALADSGLDPGPVDGLPGPQTREAIKAFQRRIGAAETGIADGALLARLRQDEASPVESAGHQPPAQPASSARGPARGYDPIGELIARTELSAVQPGSTGVVRFGDQELGSFSVPPTAQRGARQMAAVSPPAAPEPAGRMVVRTDRGSPAPAADDDAGIVSDLAQAFWRVFGAKPQGRGPRLAAGADSQGPGDPGGGASDGGASGGGAAAGGSDGAGGSGGGPGGGAGGSDGAGGGGSGGSGGGGAGGSDGAGAGGPGGSGGGGAGAGGGGASGSDGAGGGGSGGSAGGAGGSDGAGAGGSGGSGGGPGGGAGGGPGGGNGAGGGGSGGPGGGAGGGAGGGNGAGGGGSGGGGAGGGGGGGRS